MADFQDRILVANELGLAPAARGALLFTFRLIVTLPM
jgi:hypothetical protein